MNTPVEMTWSSTALGFGLDLGLKSTVMLAIVLLIQAVLGRRRALLGSAIGNAGLIGLLLLPFSAAVLPPMPIACLPAAVRMSDVPGRPDSRLALEVARTASRLGSAMPSVGPFPGIRGAEQGLYEIVPEVGREPSQGPATLLFHAEPRTAMVPTTSRVFDRAAIAFLGYVAVASILLARVGASIRAVERLRRSRRVVEEASWNVALDRWRRRLGIGRTVDLCWSSSVSVPVVVGWLRPTILLPDSLAGPDTCDHVDAVLLHELSHVRRGDYPWNLLLRLVQVVYWPNALVWLMSRSIVEVRERACDDLCVHVMGGPSAYREALLAVAAGMVRRPAPALGLAMARPSRLGRRLARIERSGGSERCLPRWPARLAIGGIAMAVAVVIGVIQLNRVEAMAGPETPDAASKAPVAAAPTQPTGDADRVFHLRVVAAETGEPVPEADVRVWHDFREGFREEWRKTDVQGRLDITIDPRPSNGNLSLDVWGKGRAMQRHSWDEAPGKPIPGGETIRLQPGETLGGLVQDEEGRPVAGATILLWSHAYKRKDPHELLYDLKAVTGTDGRWQTSGAPETTGELLGLQAIHPDFVSSRDYGEKDITPKIADLRANKAVTVMKKGIPIEGRVVDADGKPVAGARVLSTTNRFDLFVQIASFAVSTDTEGRFRTGQVKPGEWFLVASAKGHAPGEGRVKIGTAVPQVEIALGRPRAFKGRVIDPVGKPIAGVFVYPNVWRGYRCLGVFLRTDADGRFAWDDAPGDELSVTINHPGYTGVFHQRVTPSGADLAFTLSPSLVIRGKVKAATTGKDIVEATAEYGAVDAKTGEPSSWMRLPELGFSNGVSQGELNVQFPVTADAYKFRVRSPGYRTFVSRTFRRDEKTVVDYDIRLTPGADTPGGIVVAALDPDGKPLAGARLFEIGFGGQLGIQDGVVIPAHGRNIREDRTGPDGTFSIPRADQPSLVFILGAACYAFADRGTLEKTPSIRAKKLARIEGEYRVGNRLVASQELQLGGMINDSGSAATILLEQKAVTDPSGRFTFKDVVPAPGLRIARQARRDDSRGAWSLGEPVRLEPGETARVMVGGKGRTVTGRIEPPAGWTQPLDFHDRSRAQIESNRPFTPYPLGFFRGKTKRDGREWVEWASRWRQSPEGRDYMDRRVAAGVALAPDGSFRFDDVPPGDYRLTVGVNGDEVFHVAMQRGDSGPFTHIVKVFTVPAIEEGRRDEPLDLGALRLQRRVAPVVGEPAPAFEVIATDGKKLAVPGDFRGKFLLIDFGTLWDVEAPMQIARLNEVHQKFGKDPRLAILSLTFEADDAGTRRSVAEKGEPWPQAIVGPLANAISSSYGIDDQNVSTAILIGPDGKVVAGDLWRTGIEEAVSKALGRADR